MTAEPGRRGKRQLTEWRQLLHAITACRHSYLHAHTNGYASVSYPPLRMTPMRMMARPLPGTLGKASCSWAGPPGRRAQQVSFRSLCAKASPRPLVAHRDVMRLHPSPGPGQQPGPACLSRCIEHEGLAVARRLARRRWGVDRVSSAGTAVRTCEPELLLSATVLLRWHATRPPHAEGKRWGRLRGAGRSTPMHSAQPRLSYTLGGQRVASSHPIGIGRSHDAIANPPCGKLGALAAGNSHRVFDPRSSRDSVGFHVWTLYQNPRLAGQLNSVRIRLAVISADCQRQRNMRTTRRMPVSLRGHLTPAAAPSRTNQSHGGRSSRVQHNGHLKWAAHHESRTRTCPRLYER